MERILNAAKLFMLLMFAPFLWMPIIAECMIESLEEWGSLISDAYALLINEVKETAHGIYK
jgi:hypothetical protein